MKTIKITIETDMFVRERLLYETYNEIVYDLQDAVNTVLNDYTTDKESTNHIINLDVEVVCDDDDEEYPIGFPGE